MVSVWNLYLSPPPAWVLRKPILNGNGFFISPPPTGATAHPCAVAVVDCDPPGAWAASVNRLAPSGRRACWPARRLCRLPRHCSLANQPRRSRSLEDGEVPREPGVADPEEAHPLVARPYRRRRPGMYWRLVLHDGGRPEVVPFHKRSRPRGRGRHVRAGWSPGRFRGRRKPRQPRGWSLRPRAPDPVVEQ